MNYINPKELKENPLNPRTITDSKFNKLVKSIKEFPKMLELRPIVVDNTLTVLGGNMRLRACVEAGLDKVPYIIGTDLTDDEKKEFIIKDNLGYGDWDWDMLQIDWDMELLQDWGLTYLEQEQQVDYSILDDDEVDGILNGMEQNVMRGIQIELYPEHYDECQELISFWREREGYIGGMLIEKLKQEKEKLV